MTSKSFGSDTVKATIENCDELYGLGNHLPRSSFPLVHSLLKQCKYMKKYSFEFCEFERQTACTVTTARVKIEPISAAYF